MLKRASRPAPQLLKVQEPSPPVNEEPTQPNAAVEEISLAVQQESTLPAEPPVDIRPLAEPSTQVDITTGGVQILPPEV